jgi:hypothetical protein
MRSISTGGVGVLAGGGGPAGQHRQGGGDRVDGVGLAVAAAGGAVGAVDLDHGQVLVAQVAGQARAERAGSLDAGAAEVTETLGPGQQLVVAGGGGREGGSGDLDTERGDHCGDVGILVRVDAEDDVLAGRVGLTVRGGVWHAGHGPFVS